MKRIKLTQGKFALVDDWNYERLSKHKWYAQWMDDVKNYYARRFDNHKMISMHREILGLVKGDKRQADHINHNTLDNREQNLRIVNHKQNHFNQKGVKGYSFDKRVGKYQASIRLSGKFIHLGMFDTSEKAHKAYLRVKKRYHRI